MGGWIRQRQVQAALARGGYVGVNQAWVLVLSLVAALVALATLVVIIAAA